MSAYTPGPWQVCHAGSGKNGKFEIDEYYVSIDGADMAICADIIDPTTGKMSEANARLIAAAPDMLDALRRAVLALAFAAETSPAMKGDYNAVSAAIEKATRNPQ